MKIRLDKHLLDYFKDSLSSRINSKYNRKYNDVVNKNMKNVTRLFVEDIKKDGGPLLMCRSTDIVIDTSFADFDSNNRFLCLKSVYKKFLFSQIGHELLHAASNSYGCSGIIHFTDYDETPRPLNEGITQMLTEDLFGFVISPFSDGYKDYKKIAKILNITFGSDTLLDSYFYHTDDLKNKMDFFGLESDYYKKINSSLYFISILKKSLSKGALFHDIKKDYIKLIYKSILINIVISKLKSLDLEEQKMYVKSILSVVSDDNDIYNYVYNTLLSLMKLEKVGLINEQNKLNEQEKVLKEKTSFANMLYDNKSDALKKVYVDTNGNISFIQNRKIAITDDETCSDIYYGLYMQSNMKDEVNRLINEYYYKGSFDLSNKTILDKRKIFEAIKVYFNNRSMYIIDDYYDIDNVNEYVPNIISFPSNCVTSFNDLKIIAKKYDVITSKNKDGDRTFYVIDRKTKKETRIDYIRKNALIANLWLASSYNEVYEYESLPGITDAFHVNKQYIYDSIMNNIKSSIKRTGQIKIEELMKIAKLSNDPEYERILNFIFKFPETYDWIYQYIKLFSDDSIMQTEKDKSISELENEYYIDESIDRKVNNMFC